VIAPSPLGKCYSFVALSHKKIFTDDDVCLYLQVTMPVRSAATNQTPRFVNLCQIKVWKMGGHVITASVKR
jgi:hypothetical protein